jgi:hypothetical protein
MNSRFRRRRASSHELIASLATRWVGDTGGAIASSNLEVQVPQISTADVRRDCFALSALLLLATVVYLPQVGFYSDDWAYLGTMAIRDGSFTKEYLSLGDALMRPVQALLLAGLFHLFGANPLPFHLVNAAALILGATCFYLVLVELRVPRTIAFAVPLIYGMLPHYSTGRFWMAAMQATVSMMLYFVSLYADLRAVREPGARYRWWTVAAIARVLCVLAYEVFLPLLVLNPIIAWLHGRRRFINRRDWLNQPAGLVMVYAIAVVTLAPPVIYKAIVATRLGSFSSLHDRLDWIRWIYHGAFAIAIKDFGVLLPRVVWRLWRGYASISAAVVAFVSGAITYGYVARIDRGENRQRTWGSSATLIATGVIVFCAGYAVFFITKNALNTPAGIGNRVAIAAAVGVALGWIGVVSLAASQLPSPKAQSRGFAALVAILLATCVFINATLATFWTEAWRREQQVIAAIQKEWPTWPGEVTLIVDGVCPYVGPAIVFESSWDLTGALQLVYKRWGLRADVITPNATVTDSGIVTSLYNNSMVTRYPYEEMWIFNVARGARYEVPDAAAARSYLASHNPDRRGGCPLGTAGEGVPVF